MQNSVISKQVRDKYIRQFLENSQKVDYVDFIKNNEEVTTVFYDELKTKEIDGFPFASDFIDNKGNIYDMIGYEKLSVTEQRNCRLRFHFLPNYHELYLGTTGSGKTTGCMEPQLRAISSQKNKPNIFVTDPKGELFQRNAKHLKDNGYKLFILNFKDVSRSDKWNPLEEMYEKKLAAVNFGKNVKVCKGEVPEGMEKYAADEAYDGVSYLEYEGQAFPNRIFLDGYVALQKDEMEIEVSSLVNQFAHMVIKVTSKTDATWEQGSQQLLKGIVLCMLQEAITEGSGFTKDMMTFHTIYEYYQRLRKDLAKEHPQYSFAEHPLLKNKPIDVISPLSTALNNAPRTMLSYCGVFDASIKDWFQGHIFALTTGNTVMIDELQDPYAIFISTRDYEKSDYQVAGLFIDWVYRRALQKAETATKTKNGLPDVRPIHFMLDEFGNIPEIKDFENKIATARSRNIWFHLFVQSYEQLEIVYSKEKATVICDNCNCQTFLGAQSRNTKETFSRECGKHWIPTMASFFETRDFNLAEVPVLPVSELDLIKPGEMFVKRLYTPAIKTKYIRSYTCAQYGYFKDFFGDDAVRLFAPVNRQSYNDPKYKFSKLIIQDNDDNDDDDFLL